MECLILPPHDGDITSNGNGDAASSIVMNPQDSVEYLYFVHLGSVNVFDARQNRFLVKYVAGSFFGDFQLILGLKATYRYVGSANRTNYLFQVKGDTFIKCLFSDYDSFVYLAKVALARRKFLKSKVRSLDEVAAVVHVSSQLKNSFKIYSEDVNSLSDS